MKLREAKRIIEGAGIMVRDVETMKGSCRVPGISIGDGQICPTLYGQTIEDMDESELLEFATYAMNKIPELDLAVLKDRDYILEHSVSCIRHETEDKNAVKWQVYGDLEEYIRLYLGHDEDGNVESVIISDKLIDYAGITRDELRVHARRNLRENVQIQDMRDVLIQLMDLPGEALGSYGTEDMLYVASNKDRLNGASVMLLEDVLQEFCIKHGFESIYIIPSSLHEVLLVSTDMPIMEINKMITEVNETQVTEWERLSDHVYTFVAA